MATETGCTNGVALLLELADTQHILHQVEAYDTLQKETDSPGATITPIAGGLIVLTNPEYGQKLNRAVGLGVTRSATDNDLNNIESLFEQAQTAISFHLAGLARDDLKQRLAAKGYVANGSVNVYYMDLNETIPGPHPDPDGRHPNIVIEEVDRTANAELFHDVSVEGFRSGGRSPELLSHLAELALRRDDTKLFFAYVDGKLAGSAAMATLEVPDSLDSSTRTDRPTQPFTTITQLYLDSTLPEFRGQGVHAALIRERLRLAQGHASAVMLVARSASGSARNALRAGMKLAYEKQIFSR
ncbi:uncharacterized protein AB675_1325 [Cyphellophora attinorum]|uniref:N-acetyltransferase domain-containing protein n=1 Tax=Cyphellophora attinorum TaxID=1664694 RepID=A0A0N0NI75_9EURO|nr:uncharacterized protein AB675_1325 [Phialophora attinorum]KPI35109.1 hypothetical protein AB675_1325 [Phialophora attinorum]